MTTKIQKNQPAPFRKRHFDRFSWLADKKAPEIDKNIKNGQRNTVFGLIPINKMAKYRIWTD
jgi:hypothetical protein